MLIRLDTGNDSAENIGILLESGCYFIIKRNLRRESKDGWFEMAKANSQNITIPREGKTVYTGSDWKPVTYITEEGVEKNVTIRTGYEIIERTIDKYGQFLLPSDIEANELVLELTMIAYNILRMIGQETIGGRGPKPRHKVHRRRLRTVIGNLIMLASHITTHARQAAIAEQAK